MRANRVIISTPDMTPFRDLLDAGKIGVVVSNHPCTCELLATEHARCQWGHGWEPSW